MGLRSSTSNSSPGMPVSPALVTAKLDKHCSGLTSHHGFYYPNQMSSGPLTLLSPL